MQSGTDLFSSLKQLDMSEHFNAETLRRDTSLVDLLARLGYQPVKSSGREQMYHSMLRDSDTRPSFAVNDDLGVWFDHGTGKGGNIIDFGLAYWPGLGFKEVVEKLGGITALPAEPRKLRPRRPVRVPNYVVEDIRELGGNNVISQYLRERRVLEAAQSRLKEIYYFVEDQKGLKKHFFGAGWQNQNGGWEVRNRYFKGCLGRKAISFIQGHPKDLVVFEGFINYLSWRTEHPDADETVIVLNSVSLIESGIGRAKNFSSIDLFFDHDAAGEKALMRWLQALPYSRDRSAVYAGFNDYNEKLMSAPALSGPMYQNKEPSAARRMHIVGTA